MPNKRKVSVTLQLPGNEQTGGESWLQVPGAYDNPVKDETIDTGLSNGEVRKDSIFGGDTFISWQHNTYEASPCAANYRNSVHPGNFLARPTLDELHNPSKKHQINFEQKCDDRKQSPLQGKGVVKFGWVRGVYLRCILNIWGVMLFLRMGWMTGQAGIGHSIAIVALSTVVTMISTMSMSAICTNGEVKGGGAYYLISRSLGPEFGGAVGVIFSFANSIAVAMYIVGAGEAVRDILRTYNVGITELPSNTNDIRVAGIILLLLVTAVTGIGMAFENKTQIILLILLLAALMDYFVGACLPPRDDQIVKGFVGWKWENFKENFGPGYKSEGFFTVFSVFFPSVIGILAGANISGDLKNPSSALPKGTFLAIITTSFSYIMIIIWLGFTLLRDATGELGDLKNGTYRDCKNKVCPHGMLNYNQGCFSPLVLGFASSRRLMMDLVMEVSAAYPPLIYAGIFSATLSSALAALVSAPRLFQALCKDNIIPYLKFFGKGYGVNNDPRRSSALAFLIALIFTCIGDLNQVAPYISNFYMATYCLINFACFHVSFVKSPGFRPGFKYYNKWISLVGAMLCLIVMFVMSYPTSLVTLIIVIALYVYIQKTKPAVNWGSSAQGYSYKNALSAILKLNRVDDHVKNYRPNILVLTGDTYSRPPLVDFAKSLTKGVGLLICGNIIKKVITHNVRSAITERNFEWMQQRKIKGFYCHLQSDSLADGVYTLFQVSGLGKLHPNTVLMGFKSDWETAESSEVQDYFQIIHHAFDMHLAVVIFRVKTGLDYGKYFPIEENNHDNDKDAGECNEVQFTPEIHPIEFKVESESVDDDSSKVAPLSRFKRINSIEMTDVTSIPNEIMEAVNQFRTKQPKGIIDVWWLYDDGGLTMLLPYILTTRAEWVNCKLRVFSVTGKDTNLDQAQINMAALLKKFRIDISAVTVLPDLNIPPSEESKAKFKSLISQWVVNEDDTPSKKLVITKTELAMLKQKTYRHLRLRELLLQHSQSAALIVMTLPMPRKGGCSALLYMAWLDTLTRDLPPFLFIRGVWKLRKKFLNNIQLELQQGDKEN